VQKQFLFIIIQNEYRYKFLIIVIPMGEVKQFCSFKWNESWALKPSFSPSPALEQCSTRMWTRTGSLHHSYFSLSGKLNSQYGSKRLLQSTRLEKCRDTKCNSPTRDKSSHDRRNCRKDSVYTIN